MRQSQNNGLAAMAPANTVIVAATAATAVAVILLSLASLKKRYRGDASKPPAGYSTNVPKNSTTARADGADSRLVLAIDIGSSSVRCSAYAIGADGEGGGRWDEVIVVPGSAAQIVRKIVQDDGCADATVVLKLVDQAMDQCVGELRRQRISHRICAVGFACFGMNLVGIGADGNPCTPVYTYANNANSNSNLSSNDGCSVLPGNCPSADSAIRKRLKDSLQRTGPQGEGGLEQARQRTGTPNTHVSYAPLQLLKLALQQPGVARRVKTWQTLPSLIAARWCCLPRAPISYSEASWTGLLNFRTLEWDAPTLSVLEEAGLDTSALPRLTDVGGLRASAHGQALKRWPELDGVSVRLGVGDGAAACLGSGCDEASGHLSVTVGTSAAARVVLRVPPVETETALATARSAAPSTRALEVSSVSEFCVPKGLWCYRLDRDRAVLGGSLTDGGSVFEWMRNTMGFQAVPPVPGRVGGDDGELEAVMEEAKEMVPASHGLVILPFFSGERSPGYHDSATACILGLRRSTTRAQLLRAGLESVCLRLAAVVDLMVSGNNQNNDNEESSCSSRNGRSNYEAAATVKERVPAAAAPGDESDEKAEPPSTLPTPPISPSSPPQCTSDRRVGCTDAARNARSGIVPPGSAALASAAIVAASPAAKAVVTGHVDKHAKVVTSGGAMAASPLWQQVLADCLGREVLQDAAETEQTSLGVAVMLASLEHDHDNLRQRWRPPQGHGEGEHTHGDESKGCDRRGWVETGEGGVAVAATKKGAVAWGILVHTPNKEAFRRYVHARQAQERAYRALIGGGDGVGLVL